MKPTFCLLLVNLLTYSRVESLLNCRECVHARLPSQCDKIVQCQADQNCLLEKVTSQGNIFYNGGCVPKSNCSVVQDAQYPIGRRRRFLTDNILCRECCSQDHCNTKGCGSLELECEERLKDGYFFDSLTNMCAKVVKSPTKTYNQTEAAAACKQDGAKLITINTEEEQYFILSWIYTHHQKGEDFWIGLQSPRNVKTHYTWPRGGAITYKYWGRGYPEQPSDVWTGDENCVYINSRDDNSWHDERCDRPLSGFICQILKITDQTPTLKSFCRRKVFNGYLYDQNTDMCIKLRDGRSDQYTHEMALEECQRDGATLVIIDTEQKSNLINWWIFSTKGNGTDFWIGAQDIPGNTSVFVWPNGINVSSGFTNWGGPDFSSKLQSQPDGAASSKNEACVYMDHLQNYKWFDENCNTMKNGFVCQHFGNTSFISQSLDNCLFRLQRGYFYDPCTRLCIQIKSSDPVTRQRADEICRLNGDRLVEVDSEDKMNYISYMALSLQKSNNDFWIGAIDAKNDGHFSWEYTNRSVQYNNWFTIAPQPVRDCVVLDHTDQYRWTPAECAARKHGFICHLDDEALTKTNRN